MKTIEKSHSEEQAQAKLESIREIVARLESDEDSIRESVQEDINAIALSVEVRTDWRTLDDTDTRPTHYRVLLVYGGPAVQLIGELSEHGEPTTARLEHQDWGTPWTELRGTTSDDDSALLTFASRFCFAS